MAIAFDLPLGALFYEYVSKPKQKREDVYYHSQSAKSAERYKIRTEDLSDTKESKNKKRKDKKKKKSKRIRKGTESSDELQSELLEGSNNRREKAIKKKRKSSMDTEDLE